MIQIVNQLTYANLRGIFTRASKLTSQAKMNIQNFVFFDIETTGLPYQEHNKTRITELCFVSVQSEHIALGVYPRIQNKLALCFNPQKFINPTATEITGLSNELLEFQPIFNKDTCQIINKFLELQRGPVCLVAHNGNCFDYPILKAEIDKTGCTLINDIVCVDSLIMFRDIDKRGVITFGEINRVSAEGETSHLDIHDLPTQKELPIELCDGYDELLCNALIDVENTLTSANRVQKGNENTPKKTDNTVIHPKQNQLETVSVDHLYYIPSASKKSGNMYNIESNTSERESSRVRKKLDFGRSYKLIDIYKRLTNKENENAHLADQDVNMLIECAATLGQDFVDWANMNAKKFSDIPMMKPVVTRQRSDNY